MMVQKPFWGWVYEGFTDVAFFAFETTGLVAIFTTIFSIVIAIILAMERSVMITSVFLKLLRSRN